LTWQSPSYIYHPTSQKVNPAKVNAEGTTPRMGEVERRKMPKPREGTLGCCGREAPPGGRSYTLSNPPFKP